MNQNEDFNSMGNPVKGASILVLRTDQALLVKRGKEPSKGIWALPGGKQEPGESPEQTAARELYEETALNAITMEFVRQVEIIRRGEYGEIVRHYELSLFVVSEFSGQAVAGDDADAVAWVRFDELDAFELTLDSRSILIEFLEKPRF
jgi:ADP-ribose pyrophosphatase YjhB (NUDIX family)